MRIEKTDSPTAQNRARIDSSGATGNTQSNQTTSQNVIWLCKKKKNTFFLLFLNDVFYVAKRLSEVLSSPRQSLRNAAESSFKKVLPGVVVTSSRSSRRRTSSAAATQAFAVATSGETPKVSRHERLGSIPGRIKFLFLII